MTLGQQEAQTVADWISDVYASRLTISDLEIRIVQNLLRSYPSLELGTMLSSYLDTFGLYP